MQDGNPSPHAAVSGPGPVVLTTVLPVWNEGPLVEAAMTATARALAALGVAAELLVVDDGSEDDTAGRARATAPRLPVPARVLVHGVRRGPGAAKATGFDAARGRWLLGVPADSPPTAAVLAGFLAAAERADLVCGYRPERPGYTPLMRLGSRAYRLLLRLLFGLSVRDPMWVKLLARSFWRERPYRAASFLHHVELLLAARAGARRIAEAPYPMGRRRHRAAFTAHPGRSLALVAATLRLWRERRGR